MVWRVRTAGRALASLCNCMVPEAMTARNWRVCGRGNGLWAWCFGVTRVSARTLCPGRGEACRLSCARSAYCLVLT